MDAKLLDAWCRTDYVVRLADRELVFRLGEANAANDERLKGQRIERWAVVTAWNPSSQRRSQEENDAAHRRLVDELRSRKLSFSPAEARPTDDDWPIEPGCFIHNLSADEAGELCRRFGQLAAVVGRPGERPRLEFGDPDAVCAELERIALTHSEERVRQAARDALRSS